MSDKEIYQLIADELKTKQVDGALWAQAKETALGDADKTEAIYIRLRFLELVKSAPLEKKATTLVVSTNAALQNEPAADELSRIRAELAKELPDQKKHNLYSTLKLHPDASDELIAATIAELESGGVASSGISAAEFKYAKDTLSDPCSREQYDRQLYDNLLPRIAPLGQFHGYEENSRNYSWWGSRKTSVIIGILSLVMLGYLGINFMKVRNSSELHKIAVETQRGALKNQEKAIQTITSAVQMRVQSDMDLSAETARMVAERQAQEMELRNIAADRMREEQENRMREQANRMQEQRERDEQRWREEQEREESLRVTKANRYWSCMNSQLSQPNITSYDASARCAMHQ
ncbi:MAG: hypothetical protein ACOY3V_04810 [Pseudomonadota bacterium]